MKRKPNYKNIFIFIMVMVVLIFIFCFLFKKPPEERLMIDLESMTIIEIEQYAFENKLDLRIENKYDNNIEVNKVISQSIKENNKIEEGQELVVVISLGRENKEEDYKKYKVDESGKVPIMMYHGIHNLENKDTGYIGGNVDKDGYQRTKEAFINDLEFYYKNGYRMIRLEDYVKGIIDVKIGKSPLILTFDDGLKNNIFVTGLNDEGEIIIDPNCAVGIMETFKQKYPDYNVTATFFINGGLFDQPEYNEKILKWLINNGYDIGNHSYGHLNLATVSSDKVKEEIGKLYNKLDNIIKAKYINVVALPFGLPSSTKHANFSHIIKSEYNGVKYETISTMRVGWESELSPFCKDFNRLYLKRIRAYDNDGLEFDIEHNFKILEATKYISDGDKETVVVPLKKVDKLQDDLKLKIIKY